MFYNINNVDDFWSWTAVNFNVFPSFVESLPDFRRFLMILYNTPSHYCCGFSLSCTRLDLREARVKKSAFISVMKIVALKITGDGFVVDAHPVSEIGCCSVIFVVQLKRNKPNCYAAVPSMNTGRSYNQMKMVPRTRDRKLLTKTKQDAWRNVYMLRVIWVRGSVI